MPGLHVRQVAEGDEEPGEQRQRLEDEPERAEQRLLVLDLEVAGREDADHRRVADDVPYPDTAPDRLDHPHGGQLELERCRCLRACRVSEFGRSHRWEVSLPAGASHPPAINSRYRRSTSFTNRSAESDPSHARGRSGQVAAPAGLRRHLRDHSASPRTSPAGRSSPVSRRHQRPPGRRRLWPADTHEPILIPVRLPSNPR